MKKQQKKQKKRSQSLKKLSFKQKIQIVFEYFSEKFQKNICRRSGASNEALSLLLDGGLSELKVISVAEYKKKHQENKEREEIFNKILKNLPNADKKNNEIVLDIDIKPTLADIKPKLANEGTGNYHIAVDNVLALLPKKKRRAKTSKKTKNAKAKGRERASTRTAPKGV